MPAGTDGTPGDIEVLPGRATTVGAMPVRRVLPRRARRTVGAWCFVDHLGPAAVTADRGLDIGPHPHTGLQTLTWLVAGEALHRDSLGTEQLIRPGQVNLMTAGWGVSHAEEATGRYTGPLHGVQLWLAQPDTTRGGAAAFSHHADLPAVELDRGAGRVLLGSLGGVTADTRCDWPGVGAHLELRAGSTVLPLDPTFEYALVALTGRADVHRAAGRAVAAPGQLVYLPAGAAEVDVDVDAACSVLLLGGVPFEAPVVMWWNFVARTAAELRDAAAAWDVDDARFGTTRSALARVPAPAPPWVATPHEPPAAATRG